MQPRPQTHKTHTDSNTDKSEDWIPLDPREILMVPSEADGLCLEWLVDRARQDAGTTQ